VERKKLTIIALDRLVLKNVKTHLALTRCLEKSGSVRAREVFVKMLKKINYGEI